MVVQKDTRPSSEVTDLRHDADGRVFVQPADYDAFMLTQRDAVGALRDHHKWIAAAEEAKQRVTDLFMDIAAWGKDHEAALILWEPRRDEGFFAVVARDEDPGGRFHDKLALFELDLYAKYKFRLSFVMFRASEAEGVESFIVPSKGRAIYRASASGSSGQG